MNAISIKTAPEWVAKLLAVFSVTFFWIIPLSPLIAIAALFVTNQSPGWPRRLAVAGAILTVALTIAEAAIIFWGAIRVGLI